MVPAAGMDLAIDGPLPAGTSQLLPKPSEAPYPTASSPFPGQGQMGEGAVKPKPMWLSSLSQLGLGYSPQTSLPSGRGHCRLKQGPFLSAQGPGSSQMIPLLVPAKTPWFWVR